MNVASLLSRLVHGRATLAASDTVDQVLGLISECAQRCAPLLPDGKEAVMVATKLDEAAQWAHTALIRADEQAAQPEAAAAPPVRAGPAAPAEAPAAPVADTPPAAPTPPPPAPPAS